MSLVAKHVYVSGRVQGVAFRWFTRKRAEVHGVAGWTRNLYDGRVEVHCEGSAGAIDAMLEELKRGPRAARVTDLDVRDVEAAGHDGFEILPSVSI